MFSGGRAGTDGDVRPPRQVVHVDQVRASSHVEVIGGDRFEDARRFVVFPLHWLTRVDWKTLTALSTGSDGISDVLIDAGPVDNEPGAAFGSLYALV